MEDCASISQADVDTLTAMGQTFLHPGQLILDAEHNIYVNGTEIYNDLMDAGQLMEEEKYEKAGEKYGEIVALVFWGGSEIPIPAI